MVKKLALMRAGIAVGDACQDSNTGRVNNTNEHWRFEAGPAIVGQQFESFEPPCGLPDVEG